MAAGNPVARSTMTAGRSARHGKSAGHTQRERENSEVRTSDSTQATHVQNPKRIRSVAHVLMIVRSRAIAIGSTKS